MAAKKSTKVTNVSVEEVVTTPVVEEVTPEVVNEEEVKVEPVKRQVIIANTSTPFRKTMSLENQQIVGQMPVGIAYEIVKEVTSKIYGSFYQLSNGYYVTKNGNYSIS